MSNHERTTTYNPRDASQRERHIIRCATQNTLNLNVSTGLWDTAGTISFTAEGPRKVYLNNFWLSTTMYADAPYWFRGFIRIFRVADNGAGGYNTINHLDRIGFFISNENDVAKELPIHMDPIILNKGETIVIQIQGNFSFSALGRPTDDYTNIMLCFESWTQYA